MPCAVPRSGRFPSVDWQTETKACIRLGRIVKAEAGAAQGTRVVTAPSAPRGMAPTQGAPLSAICACIAIRLRQPPGPRTPAVTQLARCPAHPGTRRAGMGAPPAEPADIARQPQNRGADQRFALRQARVRQDVAGRVTVGAIQDEVGPRGPESQRHSLVRFWRSALQPRPRHSTCGIGQRRAQPSGAHNPLRKTRFGGAGSTQIDTCHHRQL